MKKSIGQSHSIGTAPRLLTIKQVADRLTVSVGCLRAWRIRGVSVARGRRRFELVLPCVGTNVRLRPG
jgi:hypothetical protein